MEPPITKYHRSNRFKELLKGRRPGRWVARLPQCSYLTTTLDNNATVTFMIKRKDAEEAEEEKEEGSGSGSSSSEEQKSTTPAKMSFDEFKKLVHLAMSNVGEEWHSRPKYDYYNTEIDEDEGEWEDNRNRTLMLQKQAMAAQD